MRGFGAFVVVVALSAVIAGCGGSNSGTTIVVFVGSDLVVPTEIDAVEIAIAGTSVNFPFDLGAGTVRLPVTARLTPVAGHSAQIEVSAIGRLHGAEVVSQDATISFVSGSAERLDLFLARSCLTVAACPLTSTCENGGCIDKASAGTRGKYDPHADAGASSTGGAGGGGGVVGSGGSAAGGAGGAIVLGSGGAGGTIVLGSGGAGGAIVLGSGGAGGAIVAGSGGAGGAIVAGSGGAGGAIVLGSGGAGGRLGTGGAGGTIIAGTGGAGTGGAGTGGAGTGGAGGATPCSGLCSTDPLQITSIPFQATNLGTDANCYEAKVAFTGGDCGNFMSPRTFKINDTLENCAVTTFPPPATRNGGYCFQISAGQYSYAFFSLF